MPTSWPLFFHQRLSIHTKNKSQDGRLRLVFGMDKRYSMLHLIDCEARESFFTALRSALNQKTEVRIEIATHNP